MANVSSASPTLSWDEMQTGGGSNPRPHTAVEAARQFEALLVGQMLKSAREAGSGEGWLGTGEDSAGMPVMDFAEQQFAQLLTAGGGLGLAKMVTESLERSPLARPITTESVLVSTPSTPERSGTE